MEIIVDLFMASQHWISLAMLLDLLDLLDLPFFGGRLVAASNTALENH